MNGLVAELGASVSFFCRGGERASTALRVHALKRVACEFMSHDLAFELARNVVAVLIVDESELPIVVCRDAIRHRMNVNRVGIDRLRIRELDVERLALAMAQAWKDSES